MASLCHFQGSPHVASLGPFARAKAHRIIRGRGRDGVRTRVLCVELAGRERGRKVRRSCAGGEARPASKLAFDALWRFSLASHRRAHRHPLWVELGAEIAVQMANKYQVLPA
jgi:hypothetical protein